LTEIVPPVALAAPSPFDALRQLGPDGEYWSARDLAPALGYERWERFVDSIDRARAAAQNSGRDPEVGRGGAAAGDLDGGGGPRRSTSMGVVTSASSITTCPDTVRTSSR
jgi:hypothetical protein